MGFAGEFCGYRLGEELGRGGSHDQAMTARAARAHVEPRQGEAPR